MDTSLFFDDYFNNAKVNSMLIMNLAGEVLRVNKAFTHNFGYNNDDLGGQNFRLLFNHADRSIHKPEQELVTVAREGNATDENYIVHKNSREIWTTGESMLVINTDGEKFIVKDIVNLESTKQLELFLLETDELLEKLFESSNDIGILILDGLMKVMRVNEAFLKLFEIEHPPVSGCPLSDLPASVWSSETVRSEIRKCIVRNKSVKGITLSFQSKSGKTKQIRLDTKISYSDPTLEKKVIVMVTELSVGQWAY